MTRPASVRWRQWIGLAAAGTLVVVAKLAWPEDGAPVRGGAGDGASVAERLRIERAIDRGVAALRELEQPGGGWADYPTFPGATTALAYLALQAADVPRDDPLLRRAWEQLRRTRRAEPLLTYGAAAHLLAVTSHAKTVRRPDGTTVRRLSDEDARAADDLVRRLSSAQRPNGTWHYDLRPVGGTPELADLHDHSNTQWAVFALGAATTCGVKVEPRIWRRTLDHLVAVQQRDGPAVPWPDAADGGNARGSSRTTDEVVRARGWAYMCWRDDPRRSSSVGMTAAGVATLRICAENLGPDAPRTASAAVTDGLAWLALNWDPSSSGRVVPCFDTHTYYMVERAGTLAGVGRFADVDWFARGVPALVRAQLADGTWTGADSGLVVGPEFERLAARRVSDTCFALLFLGRATARAVSAAQTGGDGVFDVDFEAAARADDRALEDVIDLLLLRWRRLSADDVRERMTRGVSKLGRRGVTVVARRLSADDVQVRDAAHRLLQRLASLDFGFDPAASADARETAAGKWRAWAAEQP